MKVKFKINTDILVIKTIDILKRRQTDTDSLDNLKLLRTSCVWSEICIEYFGFNSYKNCLLIRQRWLRNTDNYRILVRKKLSTLKPVELNEKMDIDETYYKLSFKIDNEDWIKIQKYISGVNILSKYFFYFIINKLNIFF